MAGGVNSLAELFNAVFTTDVLASIIFFLLGAVIELLCY